jgi:hypothetical protein
VCTTASIKSNNPILFSKLIKAAFRRAIALALKPRNDRIPLFIVVAFTRADAQNLLPINTSFVSRLLSFAHFFCYLVSILSEYSDVQIEKNPRSFPKAGIFETTFFPYRDFLILFHQDHNEFINSYKKLTGENNTPSIKHHPSAKECSEMPNMFLCLNLSVKKGN